MTQAVFVEMFGDPVKNERGWIETVLGEITTFTGGGTPSRKRPEFFEGSICWATSKDMKGEFLDDTKEHITNEAIAQSATKLVPSGTILMVVKSKILAHTLPIVITRVPTCFGQDIKGINVSARANVTFIATALRVKELWFLKRARGINTEGLTLDHLRDFPLLLPPLPLQQEFARRVESIEKLKGSQRASLAEMETLFKALQGRAFRGEL
ncbi:MAG: restriction endonuclease subunit S [Candidatus Kapaibacterium sp.]